MTAPEKKVDDSPIRWGLCCQFVRAPIRFRAVTATQLARLPKPERMDRLGELCLHNATQLERALHFCREQGIGSFRVISTILPAKTHPQVGYHLDDLPNRLAIVDQFRRCGKVAAQLGIRLVFHPDQFVVMNSPHSEIVSYSVRDLEYQAEVAQWLGADTIMIHGGGGYGDRQAALGRLAKNLSRLSDAVRTRLAFENDDRVFSPANLLPLCRQEGIPLVYDVHHHRCLPDSMSIEQATEAAIGTWNREPIFHLSSPWQGWGGPQPFRHHDYVAAQDFPECWRHLGVTIEVEAKAKELAVARLMRWFRTSQQRRIGRPQLAQRQQGVPR